MIANCCNIFDVPQKNQYRDVNNHRASPFYSVIAIFVHRKISIQYATKDESFTKGF